MEKTAIDTSSVSKRLDQLYNWDEKAQSFWQSQGQPMNMGEILAQLVQQVATSLEVDRAFVIEFENDQPLPISIEYTRDESIQSFKGAIPPWFTCPFLRNTAKKQLTVANDTLETEELKNDPDWYCQFQENRIRGFIASPIYYNQSIFCVLVLHTQVPRQWQPTELSLVQVVSSQAAISLYQSRIMVMQETHRLVVEASNDGVWEWDTHTNISYWNKRFTEIIGVEIPPEERSPEKFMELIHPDDRERMRDAKHALVNAEEHTRTEFRIIRPGGEIRYLVSRGKTLRDASGNPIRRAGTITDVTEQRLAMAQMKESNERFQTIADASPTLIWTLDAQGKVTYANKTLFDVTGATPEEIAEKGWVPYVHPEDYPEAQQAIGKAVRDRNRFQTEFRLKQADGSYHWVLATGAPILSPQGELLSFVGSIMDVHEQKQYAERLKQSNEELEQFASIVSHDLQNPLRKLKFFTDMLTEIVPPEAYETVERIQGKVTKMQSMITDLLALSRVTRKGKPFRKVNLNDVVHAALDDLEIAIIETHATVHVSPLGVIDADGNQLQQVFQNLVGNAIKFSRPGVQPVISISGEPKEANCYQITVEDNGIGFNEEYLQRIFEPFERLHGESKYPGTGLGLSIVKKIVDRHEGSVSAESIDGEGSKFCITLPVKH